MTRLLAPIPKLLPLLSLGWLLAACGPGAPPSDGAADAGVLPSPSVAALLPSWAVVVPMPVNGTAEAMFLLDTGADVVRLAPAFAARVGGQSLRSVTFGQRTLREVPFSTYDTSLAASLLGVPLDGIAGNRLFADLVVALDYRRSLAFPLAQWRADYAFGDQVPGPFVRVPIRLAGEARLLLAAGRFEGLAKDTQVLIDTGTSSAVISESLLQALGIVAQGRKVLRGSRAISTLGSIDSPIVRIRSLRLGAAPSPRRMWATVLPDSIFQSISIQTGVKVEAIVGGALLREFLVALDYRDPALQLAPYSSIDHLAGEFQMVGVEVKQEGQGFAIFTVFAGSDAKAKGIAVDDALLRVGGRELTGLALDQVRRLLEGRPGTTVAVTLKSKVRGPYSVTVACEDLLPLLDGGGP